MADVQVSVVAIHFGRSSLVRNLLRSLAYHKDSQFINDICVVDNGCSMSEAEQARVQEAFQGHAVRIINNGSTSYASGVNRGVEESLGDILLVTNNDIEWLPSSSVEPLIRRLMEEPRVGVVGGQLVYPDGSWQRSYGHIPSVWSAARAALFLDSAEHAVERRRFRAGKQSSRPVQYVDGAFMAIRRTCFEQLGGFDEAFPFYGEETDFCYRAQRAGWKVVFEPRTRMMHCRGASSSGGSDRVFSARLLRAQIQIVERSMGYRWTQVYRGLLSLALWERVILYRILSRLQPAPEWLKRSNDTNMRLLALGETPDRERNSECPGKGCIKR